MFGNVFCDKSEKQVKEACHRYFIDKDMRSFRDFGAEMDIPVVGVFEPNWNGTYMIVSEHYQSYMRKEETCMVHARIALKNVNDEDAEEFRVDVSVMCCQEENQIKFLSVHVSKEDGRQMVNDRTQTAYSYYRKSLSYVYDVIMEYHMMNNEFIYDRERYRKLFKVNTNFLSMDQWFWHMCTESLHPEDNEKMDIFRDLDIRKRMQNNDNIIEIDVRIKNQDYGYIWIRMNIIFVPNHRGNNIDRVFVFIKNVDDEMKARIDSISLSREDKLTGIWNRPYTEKLINAYQNRGRDGIFILLDVDKFTKLNDCYGHITGDHILMEVAKRISAVLAPDDVFGRVGGDEFAVFLPGLGSEKENLAKVSMIIGAVRFNYSEFGLNSEIHCSAGVTFTRDNQNEFEALYRTAEMALQEAKQAGRNTYKVW